MLLRNRHRLTRSRIPTRPRLTMTDRKGAEAAEFNPGARFERLRNRFQHDGHNTFHIPARQMRVFFVEYVDEL